MGLRFFLFCLIGVFLFSCSALAVFDGTLVYGEGAVQTPRYRIWDGNNGTFQGEQTMNSVGGIIEWVEVAAAPTRNEIIVVTGDSQDDINVQVNSSVIGTGCWHNGTTCGGVLEVTATSVTTDTRKFGVIYEETSGDALIVYSDNTPVPKIRIYNGSNFTAQKSVNDTDISTVGPLNITGAVEHIRLVSRPKSDEIALVYSTANDDLNALIWNGTHFDCEAPNLLEMVLPTTDFQKFDAAYEQLSGDLFLAWGFLTTADLRWANKTAGQCLFTNRTMTTFAEIGSTVSVAAQRGSNYIMVSEINGGAVDDMHAIPFDGTVWRASGPNDDTAYAADAVPNRLVASGWAGPSPIGLVVYSDAATNMVVDYHAYNITSNAWLGSGTVAGLDFNGSLSDEDNNIEIYSFLDENKSMVIIKDEQADLWAKIFNGTTNAWSQADFNTTLENNVSSLEFPAFDFVWINFSARVVADTTPPVGLNPQKNVSVVTTNLFVNFTASWTDNAGLSQFIFSINQSLVFVNSSAISFSGTSAGSSNVSQITAPVGTNVSWKFYANDTSNNWNETQVQSFVVSALTGWLNATLITPTGTNNQPQNQSFSFVANVTCVGEAGATCGTVNGTLQYNLSTSSPNTTVQGSGVFAKPFNTLQHNPLSCGPLTPSSNPCNVSWTVNTSGDIGVSYLLRANFTSNLSSIVSNESTSTTISIISPAISIYLSSALSDVQFGTTLNPGSENNAAINNTNNAYNVTCENPGGTCNITLTGNSHLFSGSNLLGIGNVSWSQSDDTNTQKNMTLSLQIINNTLSHLFAQLLYFWIDIPDSQVAGTYSSNFTIDGSAS